MTIHPSSGALSFTPLAAQAGQSFVAGVVATDNGTPVRSTTVELLVTVPPLPEPPFLRPDFARTIVEIPVTLSRLLDNDLDPQGDPLILESVDSFSREGGTITRAGTLVTYRPRAGFLGTDLFHYQVRNSADLVSEGTVTVEVVALAHFHIEIAEVRLLPGPSIEVVLVDAPAYTFGVEISTDLIAWLPHGFATPDARGILTFPDLVQPGTPELYYRFVVDAVVGGLRLESVDRVAGKVRLVYTGAPAGPIPFEASENLRDWFFFGTFTADGAGRLILEDDLSLPRRFYRPE